MKYNYENQITPQPHVRMGQKKKKKKKTNLQNPHHEAVELRLVGRVVGDRPARQPREDALPPHVQLGFPARVREVLGDHLVQVAPPVHVRLPVQVDGRS